MAGTDDDYSNHSATLLVEALHDFARADKGSLSAEGLERLYLDLQDTTASRPAPRASRRLAKRIDDIQVKAMVDAYNSQTPMAEIGSQFDVSASSVRRVLEREGIGRRFGPIPEDIVRRGCKLYEQGMPVQQVADQLNVSKSTMLRALRKEKVQMRPTGRRPQH